MPRRLSRGSRTAAACSAGVALWAAASCGSVPARPPAPPPPATATPTSAAPAAPGGSAAGGPAHATPAAATAARPVPGRDKPWAAMDRRERLDVMKTLVMPRMAEAFRAFDPDRYAKPTCLTCHGDGAVDGTFAMPNPELPALDFGAGWPDYAARHPRVVAFMKDVVKPEMARLLGLPEWTEAEPAGFGCWSCHPRGPAR